MATFETKGLAEPDVRAASKVQRGVEDNTTAEAVKMVADTGLSLQKDVAVNDLRKELEGERGQFLSTFKEDVLGTAEKGEVKAVGDEVAELQAARDAGLDENQFRIRTESALRKAIARQPGLTTEFRAKSAEVLGFDPTGSSMEAAFEKLKSDKTKAAAHTAAITSQGKAWGMNMSDAGSPEWMVRYNNLANLKERGAVISAEAGATADQAVHVGGAYYAAARDGINTAVMEATGKELSSLTPQEIAAMPMDQKNAMRFQLEKAKEDSRLGFRKQFPTMNAALVEQNMQASDSYIDTALGILDGTRSTKDMESIVALDDMLMQHSLLNAPEMKAARLWNATTSDPMPFNMSSALSGLFIKMQNGEGIGEAKPTGATKEEVATTYQHVGKSLANLNVDLSEAPKEVQDAYAGVVDKLSTGSVNQDHQILSIFANKKAGEKLASLTPDSPILATIFNGATQYGINSARAAGVEIQELTTSLASGGGLGRSDAPKIAFKDVVKLEVRKGLLYATSVNSSGNEKARELSKKYLVRVNTAIKALSHTSGDSYDETLEMLMARSPSSFGWLNEDQQVADL